MSQEKVDRYKQEKANRQKTIRKQKRMHRLEMTAITLVCVLVVGWIGYSIYDKASGKKEAAQETVAFDATSIQDYLNGLVETEE